VEKNKIMGIFDTIYNNLENGREHEHKFRISE